MHRSAQLRGGRGPHPSLSNPALEACAWVVAGRPPHLKITVQVHLAWEVLAGASLPASAATNDCGDALCPVALWRLQA